MKKTNTACCALAQLSGLNNDTSREDIVAELTKLKIQSEKTFTPGDDSELGQRCIFVITTPEELLLRVKLKTLGFRKVHSFKRRKGYPKGKLRMYAIDL